MIKINFNLLQILTITENTKEKVPINWHFTCQLTRIYENFKERYFRSIQVQVDCLKDSESDSYDKKDMKEKLNNLVRLHKVMQEKLQQNIQNKSKYLPCYLINGLKCTVQNILMSLNTFFELHIKSHV